MDGTRRTVARTIAGPLVLAAWALSTLSAAAQTVPQMVQRKLADNVYMMEHPTGSSNSTFIVTDEGVFVWDADIRTGDQVMAAIELADDVAFDPVAFGEFLAAQPDLGSKWAPTFVRIVSEFPMTQTNKIL